MPIIQIRATQESQWLSAPFPPAPDWRHVLGEWQGPKWKSELFVYPAGYMGNASPESWRNASNFLISVAEDGESAAMLSAGTLPEEQSVTDAIAAFRANNPEAGKAISSTATVNPENKSLLLTRLIDNDTRIAIGGLILHVDMEKLDILRDTFPESPL